VPGVFTFKIQFDEEINNRNQRDQRSADVRSSGTHNRVLEEAFVVGTSKPTALEAIAMELGAATDGDTIKTALYNLRE